MKQVKSQKMNDWQYVQEIKQQRKADKSFRDNRKQKKSIWNIGG